MLKCPLCGKEYLHDMKVCHNCESTANNSLNHRYESNTNKWRCDNFLEVSNIAFGSNVDDRVNSRSKMIKCFDCGEEYSYGRRILHICKTGSIPFGRLFETECTTHKWNCDTTMACFELLENELDTIETIVKEIPREEILERTDYKWNEISTIKFNNSEVDRKKGLLVYE